MLTVTFKADDGTTISTQSVGYNDFATQPANTPTSISYTKRAGLYSPLVPAEGAACSFVGWRKSDGSAWDISSDRITSNITLTARYTILNLITAVPLNNVAAAVTYINANQNAAYFLLIGEDTTCEPQNMNGASVQLTIEGVNSERRISLDGTGSLFTVGPASGSNTTIELTLGNNITLLGHGSGSGNSGRLVVVQNKAQLFMQSGSIISQNQMTPMEGTYPSGGGGVLVDNATFTMNGGTIENNISMDSGGGVVVRNNGTFSMYTGAAIRNNTANTTQAPYAGGGGVRVDSATFAMMGGDISYNRLMGNVNSSDIGGGGVYVSGTGSFTMHDGTISGNISDKDGGGVYLYNSASFTMSGGVIYGLNETETFLRNTAENSDSAALYKYIDATAKYGNDAPIPTPYSITINGIP
ncbi:MAG: hypothetical protein LBC99_06015 [Spirochaetota bacterium]|jgi:hypothetical protein|nr:hypothetical protein [Spirochaetota bacterium]